MSDRGTCRSCGAPVLWVKTEARKAIPLDPEPVEGGNIIVSVGPGRQETAHTERAEETAARRACPIPEGRTAFLSHFATCPDHKKWRKA